MALSANSDLKVSAGEHEGEARGAKAKHGGNFPDWTARRGVPDDRARRQPMQRQIRRDASPAVLRAVAVAGKRPR